jgi:Xaa-Pro dipeptidase
MTGSATASLHLERQRRLVHCLESFGFEALVLNPGASLFYLTGLQFHLLERPVVGIFTPKNPPIMVLPELEAPKTTSLTYPIQVFTYGEDPHTWQSVFQEAVQCAQIHQGKIGVEPHILRVLELRLLEQAAPEAQFDSAVECLASLRMVKEESEIEAMRRAVQVAQQALLDIIPAIKSGVTEQQLASELTFQLLRRGSNPALPFSPIVASGPNSANPHAFPTHRVLSPGDLLVIDWGANVDGYYSDLTRTFCLGRPEEEYIHIAEVVLEANTAARARVVPGANASQVDLAARDVIEAAGYGKYFTHRTGHGLGLEIHEEPYIRSDNLLPLKSGMTFTIEPGIYLPDRGGVRIEDNVVVTEQGCESLSDLPRELWIIKDGD